MKKQKEQQTEKAEIKLNPGAIISSPGNSEPEKKVSFRNFKPITNYSKCIKCGRCWMYCPDIAFKKDKKGFFGNIERFCKGCGLCAKVCPVKCIKMEEIKHE